MGNKNGQIHPSIQTAESMYTQIPPELYHKQFQNPPPGFSFNRENQNMFISPQIVRHTPQINNQISLPSGINGEGTYVYTRRVIDPNNNAVVH